MLKKEVKNLSKNFKKNKKKSMFWMSNTDINFKLDLV